MFHKSLARSPLSNAAIEKFLMCFNEATLRAHNKINIIENKDHILSAFCRAMIIKEKAVKLQKISKLVVPADLTNKGKMLFNKIKIINKKKLRKFSMQFFLSFKILQKITL